MLIVFANNKSKRGKSFLEVPWREDIDMQTKQYMLSQQVPKTLVTGDEKTTVKRRLEIEHNVETWEIRGRLTKFHVLLYNIDLECIYVHAYIYASMHMDVCMCIFKRYMCVECICDYIYAYIYVLCICIYLWKYICVCAYIYAHINKWIHIHVCAHI